MCWPEADPFYDNYEKAKKIFEKKLSNFSSFSNYIFTSEEVSLTTTYRLHKLGDDVSLVKLCHYAEGKDMNEPVVVFTENEQLERFVNAMDEVRTMRESMEEIRRIIREDRLMVKLLYGDL